MLDILQSCSVLVSHWVKVIELENVIRDGSKQTALGEGTTFLPNEVYFTECFFRPGMHYLLCAKALSGGRRYVGLQRRLPRLYDDLP